MHVPDDTTKPECSCFWAFDEEGAPYICETDPECAIHGNDDTQ